VTILLWASRIATTPRESDYTQALTGFGIDFIPPVVKWLIIVNVGVFLLQIFLTRDYTQADARARLEQMPPRQRELFRKQEQAQKKLREKLRQEQGEEGFDPAELAEAYGLGQPRVSIVSQWLQLETRLIVFRGQVWRLVTYAFCHDWGSPLHILFNMLFLYWFGVTLESMYGRREFLLFYLAAAVVSGVANVALDLYLGSSIPAVGSSGAVMAVLMLYAIHYPRSTIRTFWFFPVEVRWVVLLYLIFDLHPVLLAITGNEAYFYETTAHAAHLGGLAFGFLYWKYNLNLERWWDLIPKPRAVAAGTGRVSSRQGARREPTIDDRVDEVLRKLHESGDASLSDAERRLLVQASERYKSRRGEA
jgi:membrane associated rhomboid family serine protease